MTVRTRFAPSPTGYLHIGGVRTALFNWLFARKHGGQFILRIDDTDQGRNQPEALQPILDGFKWLGLDWDEGPEVGGPHGPYFQSEKLPRYQEAVKQLLDKGLAYWDYAKPEETKAEMELAEKEKRPKIYSRRWMAQSDADRKRFEAEGRVGAVKLKMPRAGVCRFFDHVRGDVEVQWAGEQDIVIQRSDGTVTYNLANVVDDFDMKITHVIRAEEHLPNTPRQIFMLEGLGYPRPEYAHVPFVAEPVDPIKQAASKASGKTEPKLKLSKRKIAQYLKNKDFEKIHSHAKAIADRIGVCTAPDVFNPVLIDFYKQVGYLPAALLNYLVLLGWATADNREEFTLAEMTQEFSLERVNKDAASLDVNKLFAFQKRYMDKLPVAEKVEMALPYLVRAKLVTDVEAGRPFVTRVVEAAGPRMTVAGDILDYDYLFLPDEQIGFDAAVAEKAVKDAYKKASSVPALADVLPKLRAVAAAAEPFTHDTLKAATEAFAQAEGAKAGPLSQVLRVATTGKEVGFSAYDTLALLGRKRCLDRIDRALQQLS